MVSAKRLRFTAVLENDLTNKNTVSTCYFRAREISDNRSHFHRYPYFPFLLPKEDVVKRQHRGSGYTYDW